MEECIHIGLYLALCNRMSGVAYIDMKHLKHIAYCE